MPRVMHSHRKVEDPIHVLGSKLREGEPSRQHSSVIQEIAGLFYDSFQAGRLCVFPGAHALPATVKG